MTAAFTVRNTGTRAGADIAQLYMVSRAGTAVRRLVGFRRVELKPGETKQVSVNIEPRLLADWKEGRWNMPAGTYEFALGESAVRLGHVVKIKLPERTWRDGESRGDAPSASTANTGHP
jgi:beta-glucosidase